MRAQESGIKWGKDESLFVRGERRVGDYSVTVVNLSQFLFSAAAAK